jgi:preprotein translocase subunit SecD
MNLGLDLQGGVHFLMEVDMDAAIERRMEDNLSNVRLDTARRAYPLARADPR